MIQSNFVTILDSWYMFFGLKKTVGHSFVERGTRRLVRTTYVIDWKMENKPPGPKFKLALLKGTWIENREYVERKTESE